MTVFQAAILGLIQGLTEFLPISSSGHLIFVPKLFGWADQGLAFDVVMHLGTLIAVIIYFRKKLQELLRGVFTPNSNKRIPMYLVFGVIPASMVGFFLGDWIELYARSAQLVAFSLIGWGLVLAAADGWNKALEEKKKTHGLEQMKWKELFAIALAQAIALIPGTSRSGITITAGLFSGLTKKAAAEFSFLMSIPVIALAGGAKMFDLFSQGFGELSLGAVTIGFVSAAVSGLAAIWILMKVIERWSFMPFVVYRVVVGVLILAYFS